MRKFALIIVLNLSAATLAFAQVNPPPRPQATPVKTATLTDVEKGEVVGRTYTNRIFGFDVVLPDSWLISNDDFEAQMKKQGYDLSLKTPNSLTPMGQAKIDQAARNVTLLLTAYRSMPGTDDNAILRISVEDLAANPQIKDAVDYFDGMRAMYRTVRLPPDFTYSETQAEQLGAMQFGYLDTNAKTGKKRMYATVRKGYAIMFTLSYTSSEDLAIVRRILEEGNFNLKEP